MSLLRSDVPVLRHEEGQEADTGGGGRDAAATGVSGYRR
jgi:hypothetical protein